MSTNPQEQEIDLRQIGKKMSDLLGNIINKFFDLLFFVKKRIIIIAVLFVIGIALAYLTDGKKIYEHEIAVVQNFGSGEYLYKKIEQINTKIKEQDTVFFNNLGIANYKEFLTIKIEPFPAIFSFINSDEKELNFKMIELMAEGGDIDKITKDPMTSRNFYHHKISLKTKGMFKKEHLIVPILNYLNENDYYNEQQKVFQNNLKEKLIKNDSLIKQIDQVILLLSSNTKTGGNISISEASNIYELIEKKDELIQDSDKLKVDNIVIEKIIKEESSIVNMRDYSPILLNSKILFPTLLIFIYLISFPIRKSFQKHKLRIEQTK
jgi:hypothetical protein